MKRDKAVIGNATLYLGDQRDILEEIHEECAGGVIITDPPYSSGGYQDAGKSSGSIGTTTGRTIAGDTYSTRGFLRLMRGMLQATRAAEVYLFTDWRMWPYTFDCVEDGGFRVRSMIVWNKGHGALGVKWRSQHELICWGARGTFEPGWGMGNVVTIPRTGNEHHPTEKPVELVGTFVRMSDAAAVIIDPFMGSGTTGVACHQLGRRFIGIEIEPEHFKTACERIENAQRQPMLLAAGAEPVQGGLLEAPTA